jgi:Tfp pilus assembly protein PilX
MVPIQSKENNAKGSALIVALSILGVLMILTSAFVANVISTTNAHANIEAKTRSFYIADAGVNYARWQLEQQGTEYKGESGFKFGDGYCDIAVADSPSDTKMKIVTSTSWLEGYSDERARQCIRAMVELENKGGKSKAALVSWQKIN